ncbi:hypothetical protein SY83_09995 [Paenibacillus swuensis]|uniref:ABC transmembrane type-1 domain-containing protein n=1 Tax=Paenibacillus swuensis TaxID=1178515 RepID=A0A172TI30_9BACL|nr:sugar ABC transporter permease [Paenibacillus swuensis]ANE46554.1 hypothetical protein SY83_09995 [Paenibacillus swuensis]
MQRTKKLNLLIFLLPAVLIYTVFQFYPAMSGFYYAFTDWDGFSPDVTFVGADNFKAILDDSLFYTAVKNTLIFTVLVMVLQNALALLFAILLDQKIRGVAFFRTVYFIPALISTAVVGFIWSTILNPVIGSWKIFFNAFGLTQIANMDLLGSPNTALYAIIFVMVWNYMGYSMIIYLAGLQNISKDLYEAAGIDGANRWHKFRNITFPLIAPALTINLMLSMIGCLKQFDHVFVLTGGGPGNATQVIGTAIYTVAFSNNKYGYGIALSMVLFVSIAILSLFQTFVLKKREVDN